jgi:hypothetical protein
LEKHTQQTTNISSTDKKDEIEVASVKYHVSIAQSAQSARGKIRARTKKSKGGDATADSEGRPSSSFIRDGIVRPNDALCTVELTDGTEVRFKCCVLGTVIELNQRLKGPKRPATDKWNNLTTKGKRNVWRQVQ